MKRHGFPNLNGAQWTPIFSLNLMPPHPKSRLSGGATEVATQAVYALCFAPNFSPFELKAAFQFRLRNQEFLIVRHTLNSVTSPTPFAVE
jgi:hypothetical protein